MNQRKLKNFLSLSPVLVILLFFSSAHAAFDKAKSTADILNENKKLAKSLVGISSKNSDYLLFIAALETRLAINAWQQINSNKITLPFHQLKDHEQQFLSTLAEMMRFAHSEAESNVSISRKIVTTIHQSIANYRHWGNQPVILGLSHPVLRLGTASDIIPMTLLGKNFHFVDAFLEINGTKYNAEKVYSNSILFNIPVSEFEFDYSNSIVINAFFTATNQRSWLDSFLGASETQSANFPILNLPRKMADYSVEYMLSVSDRQEIQMFETPSLSSEDKSWSCEYYIYTPEDGRHIDIDSIKAVQVNAQSGKFRILRKSEQELVAELCARGWSDLKNAQIKSGPGSISIELYWKEYWLQNTRKKERFTGSLEWDESHAGKLPDYARQIVVETTLFNGMKNRATESGKLNKFLFLNLDQETKEFVIKPNPSMPL